MAFLVPDSTYKIKIGNEERTVNVKIIPDGAVAQKDIASYIKKGDPVKPNKKLDDGKMCIRDSSYAEVPSFRSSPQVNSLMTN